jgi:hypothetical protein
MGRASERARESQREIEIAREREREREREKERDRRGIFKREIERRTHMIAQFNYRLRRNQMGPTC